MRERLGNYPRAGHSRNRNIVSVVSLQHDEQRDEVDVLKSQIEHGAGELTSMLTWSLNSDKLHFWPQLDLRKQKSIGGREE